MGTANSPVSSTHMVGESPPPSWYGAEQHIVVYGFQSLPTGGVILLQPSDYQLAFDQLLVGVGIPSAIYRGEDPADQADTPIVVDETGRRP